MKTAEEYVEIYIEQFRIDLKNDEISYQGPTTLGKLVDHAGEMPSSSGYCHDVIGWRADLMQKVLAEYTTAKRLLKMLTEKQRNACIYWQYYLGTTPENAEKRLLSGKDVAEYLGQRYEAFKKQRQRGLDKMNAELGVLIA